MPKWLTPWIDLKNPVLSFISHPELKQSGDLEHKYL
jgi:hypothetical protein